MYGFGKEQPMHENDAYGDRGDTRQRVRNPPYRQCLLLSQTTRRLVTPGETCSNSNVRKHKLLETMRSSVSGMNVMLPHWAPLGQGQ